MSVLESVRKVQEAEAEAEAILASSHQSASGELARARDEAAGLVASAVDVAREGLARTREEQRRQEEFAASAIREAVRAEMVEIRATAARNRAAATAALAELVDRMAGNGG